MVENRGSLFSPRVQGSGGSGSGTSRVHAFTAAGAVEAVREGLKAWAAEEELRSDEHEVLLRRLGRTAGCGSEPSRVRGRGLQWGNKACLGKGPTRRPSWVRHHGRTGNQQNVLPSSGLCEG